MGILNKILGNDDEKIDTKLDLEKAAADAECPHTSLIPHWDSIADIGNKELATYTCEACGRTFNARQAAQIMEAPPAVLTSAGSPDNR